jgi:hypothetical protein
VPTPAAPPPEPVTEYGIAYSCGGYLTIKDSPELEAVWPLADRISAQLRTGGHVYRRRLILVDDWEEISEPPAPYPLTGLSASL